MTAHISKSAKIFAAKCFASLAIASTTACAMQEVDGSADHQEAIEDADDQSSQYTTIVGSFRALGRSSENGTATAGRFEIESESYELSHADRRMGFRVQLGGRVSMGAAESEAFFQFGRVNGVRQMRITSTLASGAKSVDDYRLSTAGQNPDTFVRGYKAVRIATSGRSPLSAYLDLTESYLPHGDFLGAPGSALSSIAFNAEASRGRTLLALRSRCSGGQACVNGSRPEIVDARVSYLHMGDSIEMRIRVPGKRLDFAYEISVSEPSCQDGAQLEGSLLNVPEDWNSNYLPLPENIALRGSPRNCDDIDR